MNYSTFLKRLKESLPKGKRPEISIIIPFSTNDPARRRNFEWLIKYWKYELPKAEIIIGKSRSKLFSKSEAMNDAIRKSKGQVLVLMDADAFIDGKTVQHCADRILEEQRRGHRLWYVPYRRLYRLSKKITEMILDSNPFYPWRVPTPIDPTWVENSGTSVSYGNRYGAMCMILPRKAYDFIGKFDERFHGWGGEDSAIVYTLDTLWAKNKTTNNDIYHLWHPTVGHNFKTRMWEGQEIGDINRALSSRYYNANRNPKKMRELIDEYKDLEKWK